MAAGSRPRSLTRAWTPSRTPRAGSPGTVGDLKPVSSPEISSRMLKSVKVPPMSMPSRKGPLVTRHASHGPRQGQGLGALLPPHPALSPATGERDAGAVTFGPSRERDAGAVTSGPSGERDAGAVTLAPGGGEGRVRGLRG